MVKHIVMWNFNEKTRAGDPAGVYAMLKEGFESMAGQVPGLLKIELGRGYKEGGRDLVLYCEFTDRAAELAYQMNPLHIQARGKLLPHVCDRVGVDFEA